MEGRHRVTASSPLPRVCSVLLSGFSSCPRDQPTLPHLTCGRVSESHAWSYSFPVFYSVCTVIPSPRLRSDTAPQAAVSYSKSKPRLYICRAAWLTSSEACVLEVESVSPPRKLWVIVLRWFLTTRFQPVSKGYDPTATLSDFCLVLFSP